MKYCDLHCDALTAEGDLQVTKETLAGGGCLLQCFAAFVSAKEGRFASALKLCDAFDALCQTENFRQVRSVRDCSKERINALLTVEGGGAVEGDLKKLDALYDRGVRMMTLVWNDENELGYPNFPDYEGLFYGRTPFSLRGSRRLKPFGIQAVERMHELGMIVDTSHSSDGVFSDVAAISKRSGVPFCVSHTAAASVWNCARNLTDQQIKTVADCGGVVGLYFCADFLSPDHTAEGQRRAVLAHARAIINAGGSDVLAFGSDFDGIPPNPYLKNPSIMPDLIEDFIREFGSETTEKICYKNAFRLFSTVCG